MAITRNQKDEILNELTDKFGRAKGVVFAEYRGLSVVDAQAMRRGLREKNIDYKVAKKTLIKIAAKAHGMDIPDEILEGPIGVAFGYDDEIVAAQKVSEFAKKFEGVQMKGGVMEGKVITVKMVEQLASIPSRDVLLAKFMGSAMSPLNGFAGVLNNVLGSFVRVINAYKAKQPS